MVGIIFCVGIVKSRNLMLSGGENPREPKFEIDLMVRMRIQRDQIVCG